MLINQRGRLKIRILDFRRPHSISFNNSKHPTCHYLLPYFSTSTATCPLSRLAGEGWGEGGSMSCTNLFSPQKHKTTPILTFPRRTGEGTGLLIRQRGRLKIRILDFRRPHSISFNNSKHPTCRYLLPCFSPSAATCPLSRLAGEDWGEGGSMDHTNLIFPKQKSHPHPSLPPPDGEGTGLLIRQRGRLKPIFQTTSFLFQKRSASTPNLLLAKSLPVRRYRGRSLTLRWSARPKRRAWNLSG